MDVKSIWVFLQRYDEQENKGSSWAQQLNAKSASTERLHSVNFKIWAESKIFGISIASDFIESVKNYKCLTDKQATTSLNSQSAKPKEVMTLGELDKIVVVNLCINMKNMNPAVCMQDLSASNHKTLQRYSLNWIIKKNQKVAV